MAIHYTSHLCRIKDPQALYSGSDPQSGRPVPVWYADTCSHGTRKRIPFTTDRKAVTCSRCKKYVNWRAHCLDECAVVAWEMCCRKRGCRHPHGAAAELQFERERVANVYERITSLMVFLSDERDWREEAQAEIAKWHSRHYLNADDYDLATPIATAMREVADALGAAQAKHRDAVRLASALGAQAKYGAFGLTPKVGAA